MTELDDVEWNVLHYDPIERLGSNIWAVEGDLPGMALHRRMVILKRADGRLVIHSCMALHEDHMKEIEAWGEPAYLLVPSSWHRLDAAAYKLRYPNIRVLCPEGARKKVSEVVEVDGTYDDFEPDEYIDLFHLDGLKKAEGGMLVRHADAESEGDEPNQATLVVNDAIFNQAHISGFEGWVMRLMGSTGGPRVTRIFRWFVVKNKAAYREHLLRLAKTPDLVRIIMSHGQHIDEQPRNTLLQIANTL